MLKNTITRGHLGVFSRPLGLTSGWNWSILVFAVLTVATICRFYLNRDRLCFYSDGTQYLSEVENLLAGRGFGTSVPYYDEHYRTGKLPAVQTVHPPGFPLLAAAVSILSGVRPDQSLLVVALICYSSVPIVIFQIARGLGNPIPSSLAVSISWYAFVVIWFNLLSYMSEPVFTLLTAVGMLCIVRMRQSSSAAWPILAGVAGALSFLVRYQGIFFIAAVAACLLCRWIILHNRRSLWEVILVLIVPAFVVGTLFVRNRLVSGSIQGGNASHLNHPLVHVLRTYYSCFSDLMGFDKYGVTHGRAAELSFVLWCAGLFIWLLTLRRGRPAISRCGRALRSLAADPALALPWVYFGVTIVGLGYLEMVAPIDLGSRMLIPMIPVMVLMILDVLRMCHDIDLRQRLPIGSDILIYTGALVFVLGQVNAYNYFNSSNRHTLGVSSQIRQGLSEKLAFNSKPIVDFLRSRVSIDSPVLACRAQVLYPLLGRPVISPPPDEYSKTTWDEDAIHRLSRRFGVRYVVVFPRLLNKTNGQDAFFRALRDGQAPLWLHPLHSSPNIQVYQVNESDEARAKAIPDCAGSRFQDPDDLHSRLQTARAYMRKKIEVEWEFDEELSSEEFRSSSSACPRFRPISLRDRTHSGTEQRSADEQVSMEPKSILCKLKKLHANHYNTDSAHHRWVRWNRELSDLGRRVSCRRTSGWAHRLHDW